MKRQVKDYNKGKQKTSNIFAKLIVDKEFLPREFPGGLMVRILGFHCRDPGSVPGLGTEILQTAQHSQKKKKKKKNNFYPEHKALSKFNKTIKSIFLGRQKISIDTSSKKIYSWQ